MSDHISENTLFEILKYLPAKSLVRFRCVSKGWKGLIDSHEFMQVHLAVQKPRLLINFNEQQVQKFSAVELGTLPLVHTLRSPIEGGGLRTFLGILHGIVCLYDGNDDILLWNPSICKFLSIPLPDHFRYYVSDGWRYCYGFWIDPSTKEFKIIILLFDMDEFDGPTDVNGILYSSTKHDWSVIPPGKLGRDWVSNQKHPPIMIGGVAHWQGRYEYMAKPPRVMMSFDFRQESFEFIEMPDNLKYCPSVDLIKWQGTLSVMCWHPNFHHRWDIYMRQEGSWINMGSFNRSSPTASFELEMVCELEMGKRFSVLLKRRPDFFRWRDGIAYLCKLNLYDTIVGCTPLVNENLYNSDVYDFVESLLFP